MLGIEGRMLRHVDLTHRVTLSLKFGNGWFELLTRTTEGRREHQELGLGLHRSSGGQHSSECCNNVR
jgi:hypothetical protein